MSDLRDRAVRLLEEAKVFTDAGPFVDALIAAAREPQPTAHEQAVSEIRRPMFDERAGQP